MPRQQKPLNVEARASLGMSIRYLGAANKLYALSQQTGKKPELSPWFYPIYFLYFHSIELALKAYLLSFNINVKRIHTITKLYRQCRNRKLSLGASDVSGIANIVNMLESYSEGAGFRYFDPQLRGNLPSLPELKWTRQETSKLVKTVMQRLRRKGFRTKRGPVVGLVIFHSKPTKRL